MNNSRTSRRVTEEAVEEFLLAGRPRTTEAAFRMGFLQRPAVRLLASFLGCADDGCEGRTDANLVKLTFAAQH